MRRSSSGAGRGRLSAAARRCALLPERARLRKAVVGEQDICREVRTLVHAADPEVTETIKRTTRPYFVLQGNICALLAAKDHVNVFLYDGAIVPDPEGIITAGHDNKTARWRKLKQGG